MSPKLTTILKNHFVSIWIIIFDYWAYFMCSYIKEVKQYFYVHFYKKKLLYYSLLVSIEQYPFFCLSSYKSKKFFNELSCNLTKCKHIHLISENYLFIFGYTTLIFPIFRDTKFSYGYSFLKVNYFRKF